MLEKAFQHLAPGGYLELEASSARVTSDDGTHEKATNIEFYLETLHKGAAQFGKPLCIAPEWRKKFEDTGFVDVQEKVLKVRTVSLVSENLLSISPVANCNNTIIKQLPIGSWPKEPKLKEVGKLQYYQQLQAVDSYTPGIIARILDWKDAEVQVLIAMVKSELKDPTLHLYLPIHFVWGRKPL